MLNAESSQRSLNFESYKERLTNFSNEFELGLFIYIVKRSLIWVSLCILLAIAAAYLYLRYTPETFEARTMVQIREVNTAKQVLNMSTFAEDKNILADVELMRSKYFIAKALKLMPLDISYFNRGQILTEELYNRTFFVVKDVVLLDSAVRDVPISLSMTGPGRYSIQYWQQEYEFNRGERLRTPHFSATVDVRREDPLLSGEQDLSVYFKINDPATLVLKYGQQLAVRIVDANAKTVEIICTDQNPALARDLANAMARTFIDYDLDRQSESSESILSFIKTQKDTVFEQLRESEFKLQQFKMENRIPDMALLTPFYLERTKEYENELVRITMEDHVLQAIQQSTAKPVGEIDVYDLIPLLVGTEHEEVLGQQVRVLQEALVQRNELLFEATADNLEVKALEVRIGVHRGIILESIANMRNRIAEKRRELDELINELESRMFVLPEKELQYARIERLFSINEKFYTQLLAKDIEYRISKAGFVPENRILEEAALPTTPLAPRRNMVILTYLLVGSITGFLIVVVRYIMHDNITSLHDIAKLSNAEIGILGMIPKYKKEIPISQLLIDKNPKSLIAESFRSIRTNLQFVDNTPGPKTIAITSTISGEGKTFVAINLAGIISYSGKRVIILDLDMRKPKIHLGFGVENVRGMSTLLIDRDNLENCIKHSSLEGLDFITAGPIPPNPSELIISQRMTDLLTELKNRYDVVLIDNPPVGLVTDGIPMIQIADYPIYIFRSDYSKKQFVQNVDRLINENNIKRLTSILNGVDIDRNKYGYNYGYGYGYGYGSGYGYSGGYYEEREKTPTGKGGWFAKLFGKA